tara:strand:- start:3644 stop:4099 length:456 start_codon:yes stop_codon:yes gene_type:complete
MPKARKPNRKDPSKILRCKICKEWRRGNHFYKSHKTHNCVTCLSEKRKKQRGNQTGDVQDNPTRGNFMYIFNYVIKRLAIRKGLNWRTTVKWFSTHNVQGFDDYIRYQLKEQKLDIGDYKKTWKLGFIQTEGLTLRDQFNYKNLLVVSIKQ